MVFGVNRISVDLAFWANFLDYVSFLGSLDLVLISLSACLMFGFFVLCGFDDL